MHMFEAGKSGNPRGRPKGSYGGRIQALAELDRMMGRGQNKRLLARALQEEFRKDPMGFFRSVIMPLLPKESKVAVDREGVITWRSLISGEAAGNVDCRLPIAECGEEARGATDRPGVVP
jgi:hypothetical protein